MYIVVPGIGARDLHIEVTPEDLLVKGETHHEHQEEKGRVHTCEFDASRIFRTIHFPKRIDPNKVRGEFKDGILRLKAAIAVERRLDKTRKSKQRGAATRPNA